MVTKTEFSNLNEYNQNLATNKDARTLTMKRIGFLLRSLNKISSSLTTKLLYKMFFKSSRIKLSNRHKTFYNTGTNYNLDFENKKIRIYEFGKFATNNESILVVHGWNSIPYNLRYVINALVNKGYHVVSFDMPGHGLSEGNKTNAFEVSRIINQLSQTFSFNTIIGHSIGGLASILSNYEFKIANKVITIASPTSIQYLLDVYVELLNLSESMKENLSLKIEKELKFIINDYDLSDKQYNETKFLLIHDINDKSVELNQSKKFTRKVSNSKIMITEGLGHSKILKDPLVVYNIISFVT